ncbi:MAG: hypothetical protein K2M34_02800 [Alphaproteobacteria bacterium]|nr:hypothetical protein [Alphaproteobacteria bacterium]
MKFKIVFIGIISTIIAIGNANAYVQPDCIAGTCPDYEWNSSIGKFLCGTGDGHGDNTCTCYDNSAGSYQWETYTCGCTSNSECGNNNYCNNGTCVGCSGCSNCNNGDWITLGSIPGATHQRRQLKNCNCNTCLDGGYEYRCVSGYYGSPSNATSGCTQCPTPGTSANGATSITSCYIPSGTTFSDTSGSGTYTANCYYSQSDESSSKFDSSATGSEVIGSESDEREIAMP